MIASMFFFFYVFVGFCRLLFPPETQQSAINFCPVSEAHVSEAEHVAEMSFIVLTEDIQSFSVM